MSADPRTPRSPRAPTGPDAADASCPEALPPAIDPVERDEDGLPRAGRDTLQRRQARGIHTDD